MNDELKNAWQSQTSQQRLTFDAGLVLNEVRRNEQQFTAMIFLRDLREVFVALVMVPVWFYLGIKNSLPWSWYLTVPTLFWIAGFMIVDRQRQRRQDRGPGDTLRGSVERSLAQVEHQIWLLRNILWWYLLPPFTTMVLFTSHLTWLSRNAGPSVLSAYAVIDLFFVLVAWFVYWLNQFAVRQQLEPRRQELQTLLQSLNESSEASSPGPALP